MKCVVWGKEKLSLLSNGEKEQWFDVLNNGLENDHEISFNDPNINELQDNIRKDYLTYLHECIRTPYYFSYFVLYNEENMIVSICRVIEKDHQYYLEGLETHRNHYRKGYASTLVNEVILYLKEMGVSTLRSSVSINNVKSLQFHKTLGFYIYDESEYKIRFQFEIMERQRYLPVMHRYLWLVPVIWGLPYHKDNNKKYYKSSYIELIFKFIADLIIIDIVFYLEFSKYLVEFIVLNGLLLILANLMNGVRYIKNRDIKYRDFAIKFAVSSSVVITVLTLVTSVITISLR